ncbi:MAG: redox-sensing transcriptional repressor Rex [Pirellula sp.]|jgi:redox-sensing transcriptional repressor
MTFSEATISRLPLYLRELLQIQRHGEQRVQSGVLAKRLGLNAAQVRRDLSGFGSMGQRGVGYEVRGLIQTIQQVLGSDRSWNVILVGVGNLGRALSGYRGFAQQGFRLVGAFDIDPSKIGEKLGSLTVMPLSELEEFVRTEGVELAMIAVPAGVVSEVTERLEMAGVTGILNFAPVMIRRSASPVTVVNVDLAIELQRLAFLVLQSRDDSES